MVKHTGTFELMGDDNKDYIVFEFTEFRHAGTHTDPHAVIQGLKELRTSTGLAVNWLGKGKYKIVLTGVVLRSDSPDAP
jgi:hypothetical protein